MLPSSTLSFPERTCEIIVGITALSDWRGPYVLNGLTILIGSSNDLK